MDKGDVVYIKSDYAVKSLQGCRVKIKQFNKSRGSAPSTFTVEMVDARQGANQGDIRFFNISDLTKYRG